jgi:Ca2+-binding EF-hand superfamily protein
VEEFITFINSNVPQGAYGLKSLFSTIGMRKRKYSFLQTYFIISSFKSIDTDGDGSIEKTEFEQAKTTNQNLNQNLIQILENKFQEDANTKITYERMYLTSLE